jgi:single-strand DNA-binding protein
MCNLNEVTLIGRLGAQPKVIKGKDKPSFVVCSIATNEYWKHDGKTQSLTEWHSIEVGEPYADFIAKLNAGDTVLVKGRLRTRKWEDKEGEKQSAVVVKADNVQLLRKKTDAEVLSEEN